MVSSLIEPPPIFSVLCCSSRSQLAFFTLWDNNRNLPQEWQHESSPTNKQNCSQLNPTNCKCLTFSGRKYEVLLAFASLTYGKQKILWHLTKNAITRMLQVWRQPQDSFVGVDYEKEPRYVAMRCRWTANLFSKKWFLRLKNFRLMRRFLQFRIAHKEQASVCLFRSSQSEALFIQWL